MHIFDLVLHLEMNLGFIMVEIHERRFTEISGKYGNLWNHYCYNVRRANHHISNFGEDIAVADIRRRSSDDFKWLCFTAD